MAGSQLCADLQSLFDPQSSILTSFMIHTIWTIATISLLLMPPISLAVFGFVRKNYPERQSAWALASAGMIAATILAAFFRGGSECSLASCLLSRVLFVCCLLPSNTKKAASLAGADHLGGPDRLGICHCDFWQPGTWVYSL
jgi:hypothetical protein